MASAQVRNHMRRISSRITRRRSRRRRHSSKRRRIDLTLRGKLMNRRTSTISIRSLLDSRNAARRNTSILAGMNSSQGRKITRCITRRSLAIQRAFNAYNTRMVLNSIKKSFKTDRSGSMNRQRQSRRRNQRRRVGRTQIKANNRQRCHPLGAGSVLRSRTNSRNQRKGGRRKSSRSSNIMPLTLLRTQSSTRSRTRSHLRRRHRRTRPSNSQRNTNSFIRGELPNRNVTRIRNRYVLRMSRMLGSRQLIRVMFYTSLNYSNLVSKLISRRNLSKITQRNRSGNVSRGYHARGRKSRLRGTSRGVLARAITPCFLSQPREM